MDQLHPRSRTTPADLGPNGGGNAEAESRKKLKSQEIGNGLGLRQRSDVFEGYSQGPSVLSAPAAGSRSLLSPFCRTTGNTSGVEPEVERAVVAVDNNLPLPTVQTVKESRSFFLSEPRFRAKLFSLFSMLALLLAAVGIYGVLSQRVAQRTQEIGIRVALGARRDDVLKLIIGDGLRLTLIGIAIGIAGSLAFARFLFEPWIVANPDITAIGAGLLPDRR